jgi:hypothetical protein
MPLIPFHNLTNVYICERPILPEYRNGDVYAYMYIIASFLIQCVHVLLRSSDRFIVITHHVFKMRCCQERCKYTYKHIPDVAMWDVDIVYTNFSSYLLHAFVAGQYYSEKWAP